MLARWLFRLGVGLIACGLVAELVGCRVAERDATDADGSRAARPLPAARWWKGNLHTHTLWSDGNDFPEMVARWYRERGYHFLALSDHNIVADHERWIDNDDVIRRGGRTGLSRYRRAFEGDWVETRRVDGALQVRLKRLDEVRSLLEEPGRFALITAEEITDQFDSLPLHVNAINLVRAIPPPGGDDVRDVLRRILQAVHAEAAASGGPILAHVNHPNYGWAITAEDLAHVVEEQFFEIFNGHPSVAQAGDKDHASVDDMWDVANTIRLAELGAPPLFGVATDDSHQYFGKHGASPGRGWIMVRAAELSARALIEAMQQGEFYGSSGVVLDDVVFDAAARRLRLQIRPQAGARYVTEFIGTRRGYDRRSAPVVDQDGKVMRATRRYSADVGEVLARVEGTAPAYDLAGDELYVRAVVSSSLAAENPAFDGALQQSWVQPVGWRPR